VTTVTSVRAFLLPVGATAFLIGLRGPIDVQRRIAGQKGERLARRARSHRGRRIGVSAWGVSASNSPLQFFASLSVFRESLSQPERDAHTPTHRHADTSHPWPPCELFFFSELPFRTPCVPIPVPRFAWHYRDARRALSQLVNLDLFVVTVLELVLAIDLW